MPIIYRLRELSPDECEVKGAIAALTACSTDATFERIQQFTGIPKTRLSKTLTRLKQPLITTKTIKGGTPCETVRCPD